MRKIAKNSTKNGTLIKNIIILFLLSSTFITSMQDGQRDDTLRESHLRVIACQYIGNHSLQKKLLSRVPIPYKDKKLGRTIVSLPISYTDDEELVLLLDTYWYKYDLKSHTLHHTRKKDIEKFLVGSSYKSPDLDCSHNTIITHLERHGCTRTLALTIPGTYRSVGWGPNADHDQIIALINEERFNKFKGWTESFGVVRTLDLKRLNVVGDWFKSMRQQVLPVERFEQKDIHGNSRMVQVNPWVLLLVVESLNKAFEEKRQVILTGQELAHLTQGVLRKCKFPYHKLRKYVALEK